MEHATGAASPAIKQANLTDEQERIGLRVHTARGVLTSTQIEAIASTADELAGTQIELTPYGDIVLHGVGRREAARVIATLKQVGLRPAEAAAALAGDALNAAPGLQHVELSVPEGRITARQLRDLARLARTYADCELRVTPARNLVILNMPRANLSLMLREPVLRELRPA